MIILPHLIQELMVILYLPRGPLSLSVSWVCTYLQAFENAGGTQGFTGTFLQVPLKGYPLTILLGLAPAGK